MSSVRNDPLLQGETTCGTLLYELQIIWDEVGETDADKDKMVLDLEQECLEVYRRKVDQANRCRAQLRQSIADCEAELAGICSAMGERPVHIRQSDHENAGSLKEELRKILPQLEEMRKRKIDRRNQFLEVLDEIQKITIEIYGSTESVSSKTVVDETDLTLRKLEELHRQLHALQKEKSDRLKQLQDHLNALNSLCSVLGIDFRLTVAEVHPSLGDSEGSRSISNDTIEHLATAVKKLRLVKIQRMQRLQDHATSMLELWNLMDTPIEEQQVFQNVTCNIAASEHEITEPNTLSEEFINYVEAEVYRLEELKSSKMKELVLKKRSELEEICRKTHLVPEFDNALEDVIDAIESGALDASTILEQIELQIAKVKEETFSRKEILEKVEKWLNACDEECWLEDYNRDQNRYNAGKGTHLMLKRAEKARALVNKLPGMVEALAAKTMAWEKERGFEFLYDGVHLLFMLDEYTMLRQEKEQERRRLRDQKKLQGQLIAEQEVLYGSKGSPSRSLSFKKASRFSAGCASNKRASAGEAMPQASKPDMLNSLRAANPQTPPSRKADRVHPFDNLNHLQDDGFASLSAVKRGLDIADIPIKKHSDAANVNEPEESPISRQPFSPISSTASSKANMTNMLEDHGETVQRVLPNKDLPCITPTKATTLVDEENRTPKAMPIAMPSTPSTVSVPMQTAITPAPPTALAVNPVEAIPEETEYSFEERRLASMLSNTQINSTIQV